MNRYYLALACFALSACDGHHQTSSTKALVSPGIDGTQNQLFWEAGGKVYWGDCGLAVPNQENCKVTSSFSADEFYTSFNVALSNQETTLNLQIQNEITRLKLAHPIVQLHQSKLDAARTQLQADEKALSEIKTQSASLSTALQQTQSDNQKLQLVVTEYNRQIEGVEAVLAVRPDDLDLKKLKSSLEQERETRLTKIETLRQQASNLETKLADSRLREGVCEEAIVQGKEQTELAELAYQKVYNELVVVSDLLSSLRTKVAALVPVKQGFFSLRTKIENGGLFYRVKDLSENEKSIFSQIPRYFTFTGWFNGYNQECINGRVSNLVSTDDAKDRALQTCGETKRGQITRIESASEWKYEGDKFCGYDAGRPYKQYRITLQCYPNWTF